MDIQQIGLQLGIAGLLVLVGYRIAVLLIGNWRETEKERTAALAVGFMALVSKVDAHHTADLGSHQDIAEGIARVDGKLDQALGWATPAGGTRRPPTLP